MAKLYDNGAYREDFMALVYDELSSDPTNDRANRIIDAYDSAPTVPAEVVRHGRWIYEHDAEKDLKRLFVRIECSACGLKTVLTSAYCPNCGARMDLDAKEEENG